MLCNPGGSVQWPKGRCGHSSVLIKNSTGPHLLVVGGMGTNDSWLFDINKQIWKQLVSIIYEAYTCTLQYLCVCECKLCDTLISIA